MDDLSNLPKVEIKADLTEVANKAYADTASKPLKSGSSAIATVLDFFHNTVLYPMQKYNLYATDKLQNYANQLQDRAQAIPNEYLTNPRVNILGPTLDGLKYNLDEEHIKEMFTNILLSDMDIRKQNKVLPSYIEVVKQLSQNDASFLIELKHINLKNDFPIIRLRSVNNTTHNFSYISAYLICLPGGNFMEVPQIVLDNLIRLQIVEIPFDEFLANTTVYEETFEKVKQLEKFSYYNNSKTHHIENQKRKIEFTDFGKSFIDICLS